MNEAMTFEKATEIAQFRFALIAPVIQGLFTEPSRTAYYKRITENPIRLPDGTMRQYSYKTMEKWVSLYQQGGIEALMPGERSKHTVPTKVPPGFFRTLPSSRSIV